MKNCIAIAIFIFICQSLIAQRNGVTLFDDDWLFYRGAAQGAESPAFPDSSWRAVDLPHDWSIEDVPGTNSPFSKSAVGQASTGFAEGGVGWYRKHFTIPTDSQNKKLFLQFDGVYMNCKVWLNGKSLGRHPYGYTSFWFDISERIRPDTINTLAVEVKNEGENSRWYSGSGIYRHVWLRATPPVYIPNWGTSVTTKNVSKSEAQIACQIAVTNGETDSKDVTLITNLFDANGKLVSSDSSNNQIKKDSSFVFQQTLTLPHPALWSPDHPVLYTAVFVVRYDNKKTQSVSERFGVRTLSFTADKGFLLNGVAVKLKGGCIHHDNGPLGAKAYDDAEVRKIALLKASGFNAIRCAHNPPSPKLLDACDSLGMLVIDEAFDTWRDGKNQFDYNLYFDSWWQKDVESMIQRDRNHPSIIMWSIGNEIPHREKPEVAAVANMLSQYVKKLDSTRPVTAGVNGIDEDKDPFLSALDIAGYNYAPNKYKPDHQRLPQRIIFASESFPLDAFDYWMPVRDNPFVIGDFVWTAFDYIGEASIGWLGYPQTQQFFPWHLAYCGDIDVCGWKRPQSFYRDVLWKPNELSLFVHPPSPSFSLNEHKEDWSRWEWQDVVADWNWNGHEKETLKVDVYSSCEEVELFLNNKSLGKKKTDRSNKYIAEFTVPYAAGELKAIGYTNGKKIKESILHTADEPASLLLGADKQSIKANNQDLVYVEINAVDAQGITNPKAEVPVRFSVTGAGTIAGVGNANPRSTESNISDVRTTWRGKCLLIIKAGKQKGDIKITATSGDIKSKELVIKVTG